MFNDRSDPLRLLATRRSGKARDMAAPGPDEAALAQMIAIAARTPDHGKLAPWRFTIVPATARLALADALEAAYVADKPEAGRLEREAARTFATQAPTLVIVTSRPKRDSHIPVWEQELSAGAVVMNLCHAAHAMGFVASWLTGWAAYSERARALFAEEGERIAGFVFIGSPTKELEERPRPELGTIMRRWAPVGIDAPTV